MKKLGIIITLLTFLMACKAPDQKVILPYYNTPDFTPIWLTPADPQYKSIHTIANFQFTNQFGQSITNKNVAGKIYVANFFFTSCASICPQMMSNLANVQKGFINDTSVVILSHSVTPAHDNPQVLLKYANTNHIDGKNWWLLTGDKEAIYQLARQSYFAENSNGFDKGVNEFLHTENLVLIDKKGRIRGVYNGSLRLEVDNLIRHIKLLENED
jgi:protein SCO1/2